jgi:hypothetical protein
MKYFTQAELIVACILAEKRGYNRQLETDKVWSDTKASDKFPVMFAMIHEHAGGLSVDPHMRCVVSVNGESVTIDTDMEIFELLNEGESL